MTTFHPRNENAKIYPKAEWQVRFSNNLDTNSLDVSKIKVTPHLPGTGLRPKLLYQGATG